MAGPRVAIVIPAFNEAATIARVVANASAHGMPVVVDDASSDQTAAVARGAGADVVVRAVNGGYDSALNAGFARAAALGVDYVVTCDADGQHDVEQIGEFVALLEQGYDLVLGVRDRTQRLSELLFARVAKRIWGVSDPMCGMKGYRMSLYRRLGHFDSFGSIGSELAIRSVARGARFVERRTVLRPRTDAPRFGRRVSADVRILRAMGILLGLKASGRLAT